MKQSQLNQSPPPPPSTSASQPPQQEEQESSPLPLPPPIPSALGQPPPIPPAVDHPPTNELPIKTESEDPVVDPNIVNIAKDEILSSDDKTTISSTSLSNNDNNNNTSSNTDDDDKISTKSSNDGRNDRRVSFPKQDDKLVTGYLEPANPWASVKKLLSSNDLELLYRDSCTKHATQPIESVIEHLKSIDLKSNDRLPILNLKDHILTPDACEALEEILKRVQYRCIDVSSCGLDDISASALFDMIEYYEAANELDISENRNITNIGWQSCISMVKKSHALQVLSVRATALTDNNASNLGKAMLTSSLHTLKLEHCGLTGRPISSLCTNLKRNVVLRELWLAHNDLTQHDAYNIALLLKSNYYIQYLDISNNYIEDSGVGYIVDALIEQTQKLNELNMPSSSSTSTSSIISPLTALPPASASLTTLTTPSSSLSSSPSNNSNNNNINKSDDSSNNIILSDMDSSSKDISISSIQNVDRDRGTTSDDENLKIDDGGGGRDDGGGDVAIIINNSASDNNNSSSSNNNNNISNINKLSGRSKLDVLLTNLNENNSDNQNNFNNDDSILVQKTNIDLLTTIYEHQNNTNNNFSDDKSNNNNDNDSGINTTNVNNNDNHKVQDGAEEEDTNIIVIAKKLDTVNEEESDDNETTSNSGDGDIMSTTSGTIEPIVDDVKPNIININSNDILVQTEIPNNIIELKIVEDTDYICDDINDKNNSVNNNNNNNNNNDNNINEDLLDKSTESFEFIDPNAIDIIIPIATSSTSTIISPSLLESNNNNSNIASTNSNSSNDGEKILSQSFDDSILLKPDPSITSNNNNNNNDIESITHEQKQVGSPVTITTVNLPPPERSLSSDSLNSDTSIDSNDSKSSIKLAEMKFGTRNNGTLERQQQINDKLLSQDYSNITQPTGLQVLIFWNNQITRHSSKSFSDLLSKNNSVEILNVGRNVLSNDFVTNIKSSLKQNTTLTNLGLQGAHLSCPGIKGLSEVLDFGGNSTLQRIDLRDNNIETAGLAALDEAMKSNKSVTRIDLDDTARKMETSGNSANEYTRLVTSIRGHCIRNEKPTQEIELIKPNLKKVRSAYKCSRKISLTCQSIRPTTANEPIDRNLLDPNNKLSNIQHGHISNSNNILSNGTTIKSIGRLKSPLPSPNPSPMSSPIPSPSRNRFHVSKVLENINSTSPSSSSLISTSSSTNSSPSSYSNSRFRVTAVSDINKKPIKIENSRFTVQTIASKPIVDVTTLQVPPPPPPPPPPVQPIKLVKEDTDQNHFQFNFDDSSSNLIRNTVMGDSCSSLSSMDSIDRPFNSSSNDDSSSIDNIIISPKFLNDSLSSLEDNFIEVNRKVVLIANPTKKLFSKDDDENDTLTNSAAKHPNITNTTNLLSIDKNATKTNSATNTGGSTRVRKTSFFGPSNPGNEPNYTPPPAIAQLLSIFKKSDNSTITNTSSNHQPTTQVHATRKESPIGGLFAHLFTSSSSSNKSKQNVEEIAVQAPVIKPLSTSSSATNSSNSSNSQILQHKLSDNSLLTDSHVTSMLLHSSTNLENTKIPVELKQEIKENISPENTITAENLMNIEQPVGLPREIEPEPPTERVHFEVGGDDDDDEEDDDMEIDTTNENDMSLIDDITISTSTSATATGNFNTNSNNSITTTVVGDSKSSSVSSLNLSHTNEHSLNSKLGQIARDSLAMLKGNSSNDSQDSMISFDIDLQQPPITQSTMISTKITSPIVEVLPATETSTQIVTQPVITLNTQESQQHQHDSSNEPNN